jgi:hypothetical protein
VIGCLRSHLSAAVVGGCSFFAVTSVFQSATATASVQASHGAGSSVQRSADWVRHDFSPLLTMSAPPRLSVLLAPPLEQWHATFRAVRLRGHLFVGAQCVSSLMPVSGDEELTREPLRLDGKHGWFGRWRQKRPVEPSLPYQFEAQVSVEPDRCVTARGYCRFASDCAIAKQMIETIHFIS